MPNRCLPTVLASAALFSGSASAQLLGAGFDASLYDIVPDVAQANAAAAAFANAGFNPGGAAFDGTSLYLENFDNPTEIIRFDLSGAQAPALLLRDHATFSGLANDNLAADGSGTLWEIDSGTNQLYSLAIDGSGNVSRTPRAALVAPDGSAPMSIGDLAWGPDGLLYISSAEGNFVHDPASGATARLAGAEFFTGLAWFEGQLYGSYGDGFIRALVPLDAASMMSGPSYIFAFGAAGFTDLASFNGGGGGDPACEDDQPFVAAEGGVQVQTLWAGQHIDAGTVSVDVAGSDLVVTYDTANGWSLDEVHLWVGDDRADMPQNRRGSPKIGRFPYADENLGGLTSYSFSVPLGSLGISCPADLSDREIYIAAHAVVSNASGGSETAWGDGTRFAPRGMWGMYFSTTFECGCDDTAPVSQSCETAFATEDASGSPAAICFFDLDADGAFSPGANEYDAWGWTIFIPHTENDGFYSFPIFARAEDCEAANGIVVGSLEVLYDVPPDVTTDMVTVQATYVMNPGYELDEVYFYQGGTPLPIDFDTGQLTVALEWYPVAVDNFTGNPDENVAAEHVVDFVWDPIVSFDANGIPQFQGVHIIANASVCGEFPAAPLP
jgi:hypothetical protein